MWVTPGAYGELRRCPLVGKEHEVKRILICEDEQDAQKSLRNLLGKRDYEVYSAGDGKESIELAKQIVPDLVLLDIRMPKVDGLEVAREIRKFNTQAKIVFITAFQGSELSKEAAKYDIVSYLVKPILSKDILEVVEQALK
jgi:CheY-like chemotaxis protein